MSGVLKRHLRQECRREWDHNNSSQGGCKVQSSVCVDESDEKDECTTEGDHGLHMSHRQDNSDYPEDFDGERRDRLEEVDASISAKTGGDGSCDYRRWSNDASQYHK